MLQPCPSKKFERIIFNDLYSYCDDHGLLTKRTSRLKKHDGTVNQLIAITNTIYNGMDMQNDVCAIFLDISKVFDRVYYEGLLYKLRQIGIEGQLYKLLESYLADRQH